MVVAFLAGMTSALPSAWRHWAQILVHSYGAANKPCVTLAISYGAASIPCVTLAKLCRLDRSCDAESRRCSEDSSANEGGGKVTADDCFRRDIAANGERVDAKAIYFLRARQRHRSNWCIPAYSQGAFMASMALAQFGLAALGRLDYRRLHRV